MWSCARSTSTPRRSPPRGAGLPHVRVGISQAFAEEGGLAFAAPALEDVQPGIVAAIAASPYVTCFPESFDPAPFPARRYRDPAADAEPKPLPDWWPGDQRPLVYMTFGSVAAAFPSAVAAYRKALAALADLPVRVLLTVGRELELGETPPNVHVEQWVPQADVLAHAALVLCHGGSGTTLGALAAGRPLVVVPLFADQPFNAARAGIVGAGVVASVETVGRAVERVLADDSYAAAAGKISQDMRALPPVDEFPRDVL